VDKPQNRQRQQKHARKPLVKASDRDRRTRHSAGGSRLSATLSPVLRLTWVSHQLAHVLEHAELGEPSGTWTGLASPDHGLQPGTDVDDAALRQLAQGDLADLIWEAPDDFTAEHASVGLAAIQAYQAGKLEEAERLWKQTQALRSTAWSANYEAMELLQASGLARFSPVKPQRWVIASFEHRCGPHGLPHPHIHNIVITQLTAKANAQD
jgi:hypothetical protein